MTLTERFEALRKRKLIRVVIVLGAPIWFPATLLVCLTVYVLAFLLWMIGSPIAKAVRYIRFGDTKTEFFDDLEDAINFN